MQNNTSVDLIRSGATAWADATAYVGGDVALYNDANYFCHAPHTSTIDITPEDTTYWVALSYEVVATGAGARHHQNSPECTFHVVGDTVSGAGTASVTVQGSNVADPETNDWFTLDTLTLTLGVTPTSDFGNIAVPYRWLRANLGTLTGAGANVSILLGSYDLA